MTENPEDWKSAIDQNTGRTYWYHRKTRVSTWTRPDFQNEAPSIDLQQVPIEPKVDKAIASYSGQRTTTAVDSVPINPRALRFTPAPNMLDIDAYLDRLYSTIANTPPDELSDNGLLLADLVNFVMTSQTILQRRLALKCIWKLSLSRIISTTAFQLNQSWTNIWMLPSRWNDMESTLILCCIWSNLCIGATSLLMPPESLHHLSKVMEDTVDRSLPYEIKVLSSKLVSIEGIEFILDENCLGWYVSLAQQGHSLPALMILIISLASLRDDKTFARGIISNIATSIQQVCISRGLSESIRGKARSILQTFMSQSSYIRDTVLDAFLEMSTTLGEVPIPNGPHPTLYQHELNLQEDSAIELWNHLRDNGSLEVEDRTPEVARLERLLLQRDVEWIPQTGTSWHLSSTLLWIKCPALHEIIQGFWEQGGGGLELSIDSTDQIVASICHYIHSGMLRCPPGTEAQLELLRVSTQLGMQTLQNAVIESIGMRLGVDNVDIVLSFCEEFDYPALLKSCQVFMQSGKKPNAIKLQSLVNDKNAANNSLKTAIYESLQDVSAILKQTDPKATTKTSTLTALAATDQYNSYEYNGFRHEGIDEDMGDFYEFDYKEKGKAIPISSTSSTTTGKSSKKPKSGGIYGLLLQQTGSNSYDESGLTPLDTGRMPGKILRENGSAPGTAKKDLNKKASKLPASNQGDDWRGKATLDESYGESLVLDVDGVKIQEFRPTMTLKPPIKEKTEREKRWDRMSQPKQSKEPTLKGKNENEKKNSSGTNVEDSQSSLPSVNESEEITSIPSSIVKPTKVAPCSKINADNSQNKAKELNRAKETMNEIADGQSRKPAPATIAGSITPSVSKIQPATTIRSTPLVSNNTAEYDEENGKPDESTKPNVRSSLALLKAKTLSRNRRRQSSGRSRGEENNLSDDDDDQPYQPHEDNSHNYNEQPYAHSSSSTRPTNSTAAQHKYSAGVYSNYNNEPYSNDRQYSSNAPSYQNNGQDREYVEEEESYHDAHSGEDQDADGGHHDSRYGYNFNQEEAQDETLDDSLRHPCPDCGRRFLPDSLAKHIKICRKVFLKKRKVFDSSKMRGVEAIPEPKELKEQSDRQRNKNTRTPSNNNSNVQASKNHWKEQSEAFRAAMRAMRDAKDGSQDQKGGGGLAPPAPYIDPSLIPCPHCQRRFNAKAADRHIPVCQKIIAKPSSLKRGTGQLSSAGLGGTSTPKTPGKRGWT